MENIEGWVGSKEILVILAHPDDPEFFLGGTIARWIKAGHVVRYLLLTKGDKGAKDINLDFDAIARTRISEQENAARSLGVKSVEYLDYEDGYIYPDLALRKMIVREIRKQRPDILVTCDPTNIFPSERYINHPDHRYTGQAVIDAVFPVAIPSGSSATFAGQATTQFPQPVQDSGTTRAWPAFRPGTRLSVDAAISLCLKYETAFIAAAFPCNIE